MTAAHPSHSARHDGWSPERTAIFLDTLSHKGNVRRAAAAIGMSREAAYCRRRRDALFARAWAAAMLLAREEGGHILADRALDGVEEAVWFRGEVVGTRIRYDNRLLLAHIARLDRLALDESAQADATRFDELVACLAGATPPAPLAANDDLPPDRASFAEQAATAEADRQEEEEAGGFGEDEWERERREAAERIEQARTEAGHAWDKWQDEACARVDSLILPGTGRGTAARSAGVEGHPAASSKLAETAPSTVSIVSTSPASEPPRDGGETSRPVCSRPAILGQAQDERDGKADTMPDPADPEIHGTRHGPADPDSSPPPLVLSPSKDAGTTSNTPRTPNRAERRRRGRKHRPAVPHPMSGRQAHPRLQARP